MSNALTVVNQHLQFPPVTLIEQTTSVYLHIAAEVDKEAGFPIRGWLSSPIAVPRNRRLPLQTLVCTTGDRARGCGRFGLHGHSHSADSRRLSRKAPRLGQGRRFRFVGVDRMQKQGSLGRTTPAPTYMKMENTIRAAASYVHIVSATNARHIGPVDHARQGTFLFNHFYADSVVQNLEVWNYTAGWFQAETGLDNSTVLLPDDP